MSLVQKYEKLREVLLKQFTSGEFANEVVLARKEFFERAGVVDDESHTFESRMEQFLDWYLFSRELSNAHVPPASYFLASSRYQIEEGDRAFYENMANCRHGLFEFQKMRGRDVYLVDLLRNKKVVVHNSDVTAGFNEEEIFEGRLIPHEKSFVFAKGFCFHPAGAKKFILGEAKKVRHLDIQQQESLILRLFKMRYKFEQYKHIRLEYIYTNEATLKI